MAATRSTLLEGLEEISEEEQLRRLLEISKQEVGLDTTTQPGPGSNSYEEWASIPPDVRLQMVSGTDSPDTQVPQASDEEDDEDIRRVIEVSKKEKFLTEEEKTNLAIIQSLSLAESNHPMGTPSPSPVFPESQLPEDLGGQLESALRSSLSQSYDHRPLQPGPSVEVASSRGAAARSPSPPVTRVRPLSGHNARLSYDEDLSSPLSQPTLSFEEQMEEAIRRSAEDANQHQLSYDDQLRVALERSQSSDPVQLGARPRTVLRPQPPVPPEPQAKLRTIVIDGSNVCWLKKDIFKIGRLRITYDWFYNRGHRDIIIILPLSRHKKSNLEERKIMDELAEEEILIYTPHRRTDGKSWNCYDDRYIVDYASQVKGIVVTNDNYRDLITESDEFREQIEARLLPYTWIKDTFMPAEDPLGRGGPRLKEFLQF